MTLVLHNPYGKVDLIDSTYWVHDLRFPGRPIVLDSFAQAVYLAMVHTLQQHGGIYGEKV